MLVWCYKHKYSRPIIRQFKIVIPLPTGISWLNSKVAMQVQGLTEKNNLGAGNVSKTIAGEI